MKGRIGKKKALKISICTVVLMACIAAVAFGITSLSKHSSSKAEEEQTEGEQGFPQFTNINAGSGTLTASSIPQNLSLSADTLASLGLVVEEVYVAAGDEVKQGDRLLKLEDSVYQKAIDTLEREADSAKINWKEAQLNYKTELVNLKMTYQGEQNLKSTASEEYALEKEKLQNEVDSAKDKLDGARSIIKNNPSKITDIKNRVNAYEKKQKQARQELEEAGKRINVAKQEAALTEDAYNKAKNSLENAKEMIAYIENFTNNSNQADATGLQQLQSEIQNSLKEKEKQLTTAQTEYEKKKKSLEEAEKSLTEKEKLVTSYNEKINTLEKDIKEKKEELTSAKAELNGLQVAYQEAVNRQNAELVSLKVRYEENSLTGNQATSNYELEKEKLNNTLQEAKAALKKAEEARDGFKESMGDGFLYAVRDGTIDSIGYEAGNVLSNQIPVVSYYDGTVLRMTVSVDQADIHSLAVGDQVSVSVGSTRGARGTGTIETIETKKATSGVSQVNYNVTIRMDNADGNYTSGQTATVIFQ